MDKVDMTWAHSRKRSLHWADLLRAQNVLNYIKHHAPALIFNASPAPASVAAAIAALEILEAEPERIDRLI
jgi:7-keto-8-aminopelargonate synthetase-like enzyme